MSKAAGVLKIPTIIINLSLCLLLGLAMFEGEVGGMYLYLMSLVILTAALNVLILGLGRRLLAGVRGIVSICAAGALNVCALLGVLTGLLQYGLPEAPVAAIAVIVWLIFPLITLPTLFVVRGQVSRSAERGTVTCSHCGGEFQV